MFQVGRTAPLSPPGGRFLADRQWKMARGASSSSAANTCIGTDKLCGEFLVAPVKAPTTPKKPPKLRKQATITAKLSPEWACGQKEVALQNCVSVSGERGIPLQEWLMDFECERDKRRTGSEEQSRQFVERTRVVAPHEQCFTTHWHPRWPQEVAVSLFSSCFFFFYCGSNHKRAHMRRHFTQIQEAFWTQTTNNFRSLDKTQIKDKKKRKQQHLTISHNPLALQIWTNKSHIRRPRQFESVAVHFVFLPTAASSCSS